MVMRVTSQTQQRNALNNIFRITENMFNAQKEITSGKNLMIHPECEIHWHYGQISNK